MSAFWTAETKTECLDLGSTRCVSTQRTACRIISALVVNPIFSLRLSRCTETVFGQRTVSLVWLARHAAPPAKAESVYRRFQRFFAGCVLPARTIGALILALSPKPSNGWVLAMDRTNWKFGKSHINILVVTVILNGVGLPIAWRMLPKKTKRGNSNRFHRVRLMQDVLAILPVADIRAQTMDREFVGGKWLAWLRLMEVPYVVRVKGNS